MYFARYDPGHLDRVSPRRRLDMEVDPDRYLDGSNEYKDKDLPKPWLAWEARNKDCTTSCTSSSGSPTA